MERFEPGVAVTEASYLLQGTRRPRWRGGIVRVRTELGRRGGATAPCVRGAWAQQWYWGCPAED